MLGAELGSTTVRIDTKIAQLEQRMKIFDEDATNNFVKIQKCQSEIDKLTGVLSGHINQILKKSIREQSDQKGSENEVSSNPRAEAINQNSGDSQTH